MATPRPVALVSKFLPAQYLTWTNKTLPSVCLSPAEHEDTELDLEVTHDST